MPSKEIVRHHEKFVVMCRWNGLFVFVEMIACEWDLRPRHRLSSRRWGCYLCFQNVSIFEIVFPGRFAFHLSRVAWAGGGECEALVFHHLCLMTTAWIVKSQDYLCDAAWAKVLVYRLRYPSSLASSSDSVQQRTRRDNLQLMSEDRSGHL